MTLLKEQAFEVIKRMPDEKMVYIMEILQNIEVLSKNNDTDHSSHRKLEALERLEKLKKPLSSDFDYDKELAEAREEKYGNIN